MQKTQQLQIVTHHTHYGNMLVAYTEHGICSIQLGDSKEKLEFMLRQDFPKAIFVHGSIQTWIPSIYAFIEGETEKDDEFPLDLYGTPFHKQVWNALREIPRGEVCSYSEVAAKISFPKAARAVATACARNKLAIVIPCHRVVRQDGSISGYKWGVARKRALLKQEGVNYV